MYTIEMLPAKLGDCLWVEYGEPASPSRILIDGGTVGTIDAIKSKIHAVAAREGRCHLELVVVSHIDADHIEGIIKLLGEPSLPVDIDDIWFNGNQHLPAPDGSNEDDFLGGKQGDFLSLLIRRRALSWNREPWDGETVYIPREQHGSLPRHTLPGGMELTLLSPSFTELRKLSKSWADELDKAGLANWTDSQILEELLASRTLAPEDDFLGDEGFLGDEPIDVARMTAEAFRSDTSPANGSSIAFVASFSGTSAILSGDAYSTVLEEGVARLLRETGESKLRVDAFKLPHHGSRANVHDGLLERLDCRRFLVSTDGSRFKHPDPEAIARVVAGAWRSDPGNAPPIELCFNYHTKFNGKWDDEELADRYNYSVTFPETASDEDQPSGLLVTLAD